MKRGNLNGNTAATRAGPVPRVTCYCAFSNAFSLPAALAFFCTWLQWSGSQLENCLFHPGGRVAHKNSDVERAPQITRSSLSKAGRPAVKPTKEEACKFHL